MRHAKIKFVGIVASFVAVVLTLASVVLPKVFADTEYFVTNTASIDFDATNREVTIELKANNILTLYGIEGKFTVGAAETAVINKMAPATALTDIVAVTENAPSDGTFIWKNAGAGAEFAAGDVIWSATYTVANELAAGDYNLPIALEVYSFGSGDGDTHEKETVAAKITVVASLTEQELSFDDETVNKTWEDGNFTITANHTTGDGEVTYTSSDENVATVDSETGEVTIKGVGSTAITATAAETETYAETKASYTLTVNKKEVSITSAGVNDKIYDGIAAVEENEISVELSQSGLDYDKSAVFADASAGTGKTATVTVTLKGESAEHYVLTGDTYEVTATIEPFEVYAEDIALATDEPIYYSGEENKPAVVITVELDEESETKTVLVEGTDYTVDYPEDTKTAGEKTLVVKTKGNYTDDDDLEVTYTVNPHVLTDSNIVVNPSTARYTGREITPSVEVYIGGVLVDANEYEVGYTDNIAAGAATVTVTAKENMNISGSATATFEIIPKNVLGISGISSQKVVYNGAPVKLAGTLAVGSNEDNITVADVVTTWYDEDGNEIAQPTDAGSYKVVYSYDGVNYEGTLDVSFEILRATSPEPVEAKTEFRVAEKTPLTAIAGVRTRGFAWLNPSDVVLAGEHTYAATYTYNGDTKNYTTINLEISVYGLAIVNVDAKVDGAGGAVTAPVNALEGNEVVFEFAPADGYEIDTVRLNTFNVTSQVVDNTLTITAGTTDIDLVVKYHRIYMVLEGDGAAYVAEAGQAATFRIDADHDTLFLNGGMVYVDGILIGEGYYRHASGSTVITLTEQFIATLPSGVHTLTVVFNDGGVANATFAVSNPTKDAEIAALAAPDTGFFTGSTNAKIAGFGALIVTLAGVSLVISKRFAKAKIDFDKK